MTAADGDIVTVSGTVTALERRLTRRGRAWAIATVADEGGPVEVMVFPQTYTTVRDVLAEDAAVVVTGRANRRDGMPVVYALEVSR